jgi:MATE family multidrug resistance protein
LTAAGDTRFVMKFGGSAPILLALMPVYLVVFTFEAPPNITWMLIAIYAIVSATIYFLRFRGEKWKTLSQ